MILLQRNQSSGIFNPHCPIPRFTFNVKEVKHYISECLVSRKRDISGISSEGSRSIKIRGQIDFFIGKRSSRGFTHYQYLGCQFHRFKKSNVQPLRATKLEGKAAVPGAEFSFAN